MSESQARGRSGKRARRFKAMLWSMVAIVVGSMVLPLTGYVYTAAVHAQEQSAEKTNPRSEYWREVREGNQGYTAVVGQETDVLIQNGGQNWREIRNGPVSTLGAVLVLAVIVAVLAYQFTKGGFKLEKRTGRTVLRWPVFDRVLHWYTAVLFIILTITGLSLIWGRAVLIPVFGKEGFAAWAELAKWMHNYLALFFTAGLVVMLAAWFKDNIFKPHDLEWIKQAGGYLGGGHPPAGFANAGEKAYFWTLLIAGGAVVISGFFMLFPNLGFDRSAMQLANVFHGAASMIVIAFVCLHIYLGTLGSEGAFEGMWTGEVDEAWARQHHNLWFEEVSKQGPAPAGRESPGRSVPASA